MKFMRVLLVLALAVIGASGVMGTRFKFRPWGPVKPPSNDDKCCGKFEFCCSGTCRKRDPRANPFCFTRKGCCPPPDPPAPGTDPKCKKNCCPAYKPDCVCGGCTVWNGFPVLCAAGGPKNCCENPNEVCSTGGGASEEH